MSSIITNLFVTKRTSIHFNNNSYRRPFKNIIYIYIDYILLLYKIQAIFL